eukprot:GHVN01033651.1.p1 GENE.GHVN01033651.1~~GHVN01033651.1.p1  ORF type:complete len:290 (-),score=27.16 GHVN01033651.1:217-1086(-)
MKIRKLSILLILFFFIAALSAQADSPVWKVVKGERTLFIGGTFHSLTPSDYPLPDAFEHAYKSSSIIVFETDIQKLKTPEIQQAMIQQWAYPEGVTLKDTLDQETYSNFLDYLAERGIPQDNIVKFKAGMVSGWLRVVEMKRLGLSGTGVDEFYSLRALNDHKELGELETADEQIAFLAKMGEGKESELIECTINLMNELPTIIKVVKQAWRIGDIQKLNELGIEPMKERFPEIYAGLISNRNNAWMSKIDAMLETPEIAFVLFGVLHLAGDDGVLAQLKAKGYTIEQL